MSDKRKGFTLIELLVVIAIIALLLAILMPSLKKAKAKAQQVFCKNNCKTLGMANAMYAHEHDGYFVSNHDKGLPKVWDREPIWCTNQTYIGYIAISKDDAGWAVKKGSFELPEKYHCPSAKMRDWDDPSWGNWVVRTTYGMNGYDGPHFFGSNAWRSTKIRNPSGKMIFIDGSDILATFYGAAYKTKWDISGDYYRDPENPNGALRMTSYRHSEKANITFADGHADSMKKEDVYTYNDDGTTNDARNDQLWLVHQR